VTIPYDPCLQTLINTTVQCPAASEILFSFFGASLPRIYKELAGYSRYFVEELDMLIYLPGSLTVLTVLLFPYIFYQCLPDISGSTDRKVTELTASNFAPVIRVSIAWAVLYYGFLFFQSWSALYALSLMKTSKVDAKTPSLQDVKYRVPTSAKHPIALNADRTVGNMMEQSFPFLLSLWLHAIFISVDGAAKLGWAWLLSRVIYPAVFTSGIPILFLSTMPGYLFILLLFVPVWQAVF
jgi:uncharacterized MAPEG superfamily protein